MDHYSSTGYECEKCKETFYYLDEVIFYLSGVEVYPEESSPDWDRVLCTTCSGY